MKLCFIADVNSIHARRWIEYFCTPQNEVHILSTTYCTKPVKGTIVHNLLMSGRGSVTIDGIGIKENSDGQSDSLSKVGSGSKIGRLLPQRIRESELFHISSLLHKTFKARSKARAIIRKLQPDLVHCLRLPIEGYIGGLVGYRPLVMTTFGNDMVYFAKKYKICRWLTKKAMSKVNLYFSDSLRDKYIAEAYGFSPLSLTFITPVTGGLKLKELPIYQKNSSIIKTAKQKIGIDPETNLLISVRGFKYFYVYTETLIRAIPRIVKIFPNSIFVLKGDIQSLGYFQLRKIAEDLGVEKYIRFVKRLNAKELIDYFMASDIMVSSTLYDGCPISMLEGMAYGLIPVMSLHSPIQEWIKDGENGYLFNPKDPDNLAQAIIKALKKKENFGVMREINWSLLKKGADYYRNMKIAEKLYHRLINDRRTNTKPNY